MAIFENRKQMKITPPYCTVYNVHMSSYCHTTVSYCSRVFVVQVNVNLFNVVPVNVIHVTVGPSVYQKQTYYI